MVKDQHIFIKGACQLHAPAYFILTQYDSTHTMLPSILELALEILEDHIDNYNHDRFKIDHQV